LNEKDGTLGMVNASTTPILRRLWSGKRSKGKDEETYAAHKPKRKKTKNLRVNHFPQRPLWSRYQAFQKSLLDSDFPSFLPAFVIIRISAFDHSAPIAGTVTSSTFSPGACIGSSRGDDGVRICWYLQSANLNLRASQLRGSTHPGWA